MGGLCYEEMPSIRGMSFVWHQSVPEGEMYSVLNNECQSQHFPQTHDSWLHAQETGAEPGFERRAGGGACMTCIYIYS